MNYIRQTIVISFIFILFLSLTGCTKQNGNYPPEPPKQKVVQDTPQGQKELNSDVGNELKRATEATDSVYNKILLNYKDNMLFIDKLKASEAAWAKFRDAHLEAIYPEKDKQLAYGSVYPMVYGAEKTKLTQAREKQLQRWLVENQASLKEIGGKNDGQADFPGRVNNELKRADDTLNTVYKQILAMYKNNPTFIDKLTEAELAWIDFRDAELELVRSAPNLQKMYGELSPVAVEYEKARLTLDRVNQLHEWVDGVPEGTVGAGSRRAK